MGRDYPAALAPGGQGKLAAGCPLASRGCPSQPPGPSPHKSGSPAGAKQRAQGIGGHGWGSCVPCVLLTPLSCLPNTWPTLHGLKHRRKAVCTGSNGGGLQLREGLSGRVGEGRNDAGGVTLDSKILWDLMCVCACPSLQACVCALIPRSPGTAVLDPVSPRPQVGLCQAVAVGQRTPD